MNKPPLILPFPLHLQGSLNSALILLLVLAPQVQRRDRQHAQCDQHAQRQHLAWLVRQRACLLVMLNEAERTLLQSDSEDEA